VAAREEKFILPGLVLKIEAQDAICTITQEGKRPVESAEMKNYSSLSKSW